MNLIKEKFVPWAPRWGSTGHADEDQWSRIACGGNKPRIAGTLMVACTAAGAAVKGDTFEGVLQTFAQLPESERKPVIGPRGPYDPTLHWGFVDRPLPPGAMVINVHCRVLESDGQGPFRAARKIDLTEFGGKASGNGLPGRFEEPQRDAIWLTAEEWKSLVPATPRKGDAYPVPTPIRQRIFLFYVFNRYNWSGGGIWRPQNLRSGELTLTVEDASSKAVRMRLEGSALFKSERSRESFAENAKESGQKGLPETIEVSYDVRLLGIVEYDLVKKSFTRFDAVALGDYRGQWGHALKVNPVPVGISLELDPRPLPPERRHAPFALSEVKDHYWTPDKWQVGK